MKVFSVIGVSKSGKTTTIENIIKELRKRNYSVGSVKEINSHEFKMDTEGTNTHRHKMAGSQLVTARGRLETDILFQSKLEINEILSFYNHDFVILEGVRDTDSLKIVTAHNTEEIQERLDERVFAIAGQISNKINSFHGLPVINPLTDIEKLVDLIEEKVLEEVVHIKEDPCQNIILKINGKEIKMVTFVQNVLKNAVEAVAKELEGYTENGDIEVCIKR